MRQRQADQRHHENRRDAKHTIHEHRGNGVGAAHVEFRDAVGAQGVAADAWEKRPDERADEEDAQDLGERRACGAIDDAEQHDPAIAH